MPKGHILFLLFHTPVLSRSHSRKLFFVDTKYIDPSHFYPAAFLGRCDDSINDLLSLRAAAISASENKSFTETDYAKIRAELVRQNVYDE